MHEENQSGKSLSQSRHQESTSGIKVSCLTRPVQT